MTHKSADAWCVVPAAGVGARLGGDMPKQYLRLGDCSIIEHAVAAFRRSAEIAGVIVGIAEQDDHWGRLDIAGAPDVHCCTGGPTRAHTVVNALEHLLHEVGAAASDWVMVHDAARPLVSTEEIEGLLAVCRSEGQGAILAAPMVDTVKRSDGSGRVAATEDRESLWRALTPQCFPLGALAAAIRSSIRQGRTSTDESAAMEMAGHAVRIVEGSARNIKITLAADLSLAQCLTRS